MPYFFTVRWPLFARLEVLLFFPVACRLASEIGMVRTLANRGIGPTLAPLGFSMGLSRTAIYWAAVAIIVVLPYLLILLAADRFMTVRKGFAALSVIAICIWAGTAQHLSWLLRDLVPRSIADGSGRLWPDQKIGLIVGGVALLLHLRALWCGLQDEGDVAERLIAARREQGRRRGLGGTGPAAQDEYYRRTSDFRGWRDDEPFAGLGGGPREHPAVKVLYAITWIGVVVGIGFAYQNWNNSAGDLWDVPGGNHVAAAGPLLPAAGPTRGVLKTEALAPAAGSRPAANMHVATTPALPMVQRPTELSGSTQSGSAISGPNEAVSERANDGSFAFDALVNGTHLRMLFDTGASVVGLRAEDAVRLGVPVDRLAYSAKIKTANGTADVAPVLIDTMTIGNITLRRVTGFVAKEGMLHENLLGQTFLERLAGFNVEKNLLVLKGR